MSFDPDDDRDDDIGHANAPAETGDRPDERRATREGVGDRHPGDAPEGFTDERHAGEGYTRGYPGEAETSWTAIAGALVLVGVVLFFIPEPITSSLGVLLVVAGVGLWVADVLS
jgi:hypothetical protein